MGSGLLPTKRYSGSRQRLPDLRLELLCSQGRWLPCRFVGTIVSGTESGFYVVGSNNKLDNDLSINGSGAGFNIVGSYNSVVNSLSSGGGAGFQVTGPGIGNTFTNDVASGNQVGFNIFAPADISAVALIGNWEAGIAIRTGGQATVRNSNIFGNGTVQPSNCGIENYSGTAATASKIYWGARTGPGPDPADAVCDYNGSTTTVPSIQATPRTNISFSPKRHKRPKGRCSVRFGDPHRGPAG